MNAEIWKDIIGYEGIYQISNLGRVKRLAGKCLAKAGKYRTVSESILTCFPNKTRYNYLYVNLNNNGIKQFRVHRLVAIHFIPNPNNLPQVNHIDGDKNNNSINNLEWCTRSENSQHAYDTGLKKPYTGIKDHGNNKFADEWYELFNQGMSLRKIGRQYNVDHHTVLRTINKRKQLKIK